jgi:HAD superfamily hydrolase (TIGR01509 family)
MSKYSLYDLMIEDIRKAYNVYVDMDGVLTDFERRFEQFAGVTPDEFTAQKTIEFGKAKADEQFWDLVDKQIGVRFWAGMPWMPEGEKLYKYIKKTKPTILTSPSRDESSRIGKGVWVKRNMSGVPVKFGYKASGKAKYATPNSILIDDREDNISAWKAAGGIGILFKSTDQVINELSKLGL